MSRNILDLARTRALALSTASAREQLDRTSADAAIRRTIRSHGGVRGCAEALAQQYGEHPELTAPRVRWASQRVAALYPPASASGSGTLHMRKAAAPQVREFGSRGEASAAAWTADQLAAA